MRNLAVNVGVNIYYLVFQVLWVKSVIRLLDKPYAAGCLILPIQNNAKKT